MFIFHHEYDEVDQIPFMESLGEWDKFFETNWGAKIRWVNTNNKITKKRKRTTVHKPFTVKYNLTKNELRVEFKMILLNEFGEPLN